MPALTRRRYPERQDCWHVYFGDVHVGTIARRFGQPFDQEAWQWLCGFDPGDQRSVSVQGKVGNPAEYLAGLELSIGRGWLWRHESGTYVKFTPAGADLFA
jgi:hypothetical protein